LPMPVPHLGTLYLTVSRTLILLCKPSNAILRLSFFLHTSTFSAFEVSYKNALYKSTVIICTSVNEGQSNCLYSILSDRRQDYLGSPFLDEYKFDVELVETVFFADEKR